MNRNEKFRSISFVLFRRRVGPTRWFRFRAEGFRFLPSAHRANEILHPSAKRVPLPPPLCIVLSVTGPPRKKKKKEENRKGENESFARSAKRRVKEKQISSTLRTTSRYLASPASFPSVPTRARAPPPRAPTAPAALFERNSSSFCPSFPRFVAGVASDEGK